MTYVVHPDRYEVTSGAVNKKTILTNLPDLFYNQEIVMNRQSILP